MKKSIGKPYEGKLHVRFDEGGADSLIYYVIFGNMMEKKDYQALLYYPIKKEADSYFESLKLLFIETFFIFVSRFIIYG